VPWGMFSYKTGIILVVNHPCLVQKHSPWHLYLENIPDPDGHCPALIELKYTLCGLVHEISPGVEYVGNPVCGKEREVNVKKGRLKEQCSLEEGQELTDVSYALMLEYRHPVFIPTRGIYIQKLVSKFHWHYCPPLVEILSSH